MMLEKKKLIQISVIAFCIIGAIVMYFALSGSPSPTPVVNEAAAKQEVIEEAIKHQEASQPPPPEIQRNPSRGKVALPGGG